METKLTHLALHIIGNKAAEEGVHLAKSNVSLSEELRNTLSNFFLGNKTDSFSITYHRQQSR